MSGISDINAGSPDETLSALFARQVRERPEHPAVVFGDRRLSYARLDARAQLLARRLADRGVRPGARVAVMLPRSEMLVIALLAIVRAGAAFVPIDPGYPAARIAFMLADAEPACVLTTREHAGPSFEAPLLLVDDELAEPAGAASTGPGTDEAGPFVSPLAAAYVLFTSGSTGRPKGVAVSHRAIVRHLRWMQEQFRLLPGERVLQKTPAGFDVSVWEFFWPLIVGATLVVADPDAHRDPALLADLVRTHRISVMHFVPSMLRQFLAEPTAVEAARASLRLVITSGEELPRDLSRRFLETVGCELYNLYGPTEAAIDVTFHRCDPDDGPRVPIGTPVAETRMYVLDSELRPVARGDAGELYIAGVQLADHYLNRRGLTSERFVACPFEPGGARMYRTGDLGRVDERGRLEFLGRADAQMKVFGVRVEPGEIESVFTAHPAVGQAVVVLSKAIGPEPELLAFVTLDADAGADRSGRPAAVPDTLVRDLRLHAVKTLPPVLVPYGPIVLPAFPLTANGKIDRAALAARGPAPQPRADPAPPSAPASGAAPGPVGVAELEELLSRLFARFTDSAAIGPDESFFALGGTSLSAMRFIAQASRELGLSVQLRTLAKAPTVRLLARRIEDELQRRPDAVSA